MNCNIVWFMFRFMGQSRAVNFTSQTQENSFVAPGEMWAQLTWGLALAQRWRWSSSVMDASSSNGNASQPSRVQPVEVREIASILSTTQNQSENRTRREARQTAVWRTCSLLLSLMTQLEYGLCVHQNKTITSSVAESIKVVNTR